MRCQPSHRAVAAALLCVNVFVAPSRASADASSSAAAEALFAEGKKLVEKKDYAAACPKLAASQKLDPGAGTLLNLGDCYEHLGKLASAWASYVEAGAAARARNRQDWAENANKRAERLEPRVPKLVIVAKAATPGMEVSYNGVHMDAAALGSALPVDPGSQVVEARAKGFRSWSQTIEAKEGKRVTLEVPALVAEAVPDAAVASTPTQPLQPTQPTVVPHLSSSPTDASPSGGLRTLGFITLAVGALGLGAGAVTGIFAMQNNNRGKELCPELRCSNVEGVDAANDARTFGTVSTIAFVGGGVLAAAGLTMVLLGGSHRHAESRSALRVMLSPTLGGGLVSGVFQ